MVSSESLPFAKVGGLGDVVYSLSRKLVSRNVKVSIVMPFYKCIKENVSSLAQNIGYAYVLDFKDYHLNYEKGIDSVTLADVSAAAKRMTEGPMYFGITTNN